MNASEWYKPLLNPKQKVEDDLRQIFSTQGGEIISGVLHDMTDTELKVTHYLVGEALLVGEDIFDRIECWRILRSVDK